MTTDIDSIAEIVENSELAREAKSYFDNDSADQMIRELKADLKAEVKADKKQIERLKKAINLVIEHYPADSMSDQMGEDYDSFQKLIK